MQLCPAAELSNGEAVSDLAQWAQNAFDYLVSYAFRRPRLAACHVTQAWDQQASAVVQVSDMNSSHHKLLPCTSRDCVLGQWHQLLQCALSFAVVFWKFAVGTLTHTLSVGFTPAADCAQQLQQA